MAVKLRLFAIFSRALDDVLRLEKELFEEKSPVKIKDAQGKEQIVDCKKFYMDVTKVAFNNLQKAQKKFLDATVEYGSNMTDANNLKAYNLAEKNYISALDAYSKEKILEKPKYRKGFLILLSVSVRELIRKQKIKHIFYRFYRECLSHFQVIFHFLYKIF